MEVVWGLGKWPVARRKRMTAEVSCIGLEVAIKTLAFTLTVMGAVDR